MTNTSHADRPEMAWHAVTDALGRTRMEASWAVPSEAATLAPVVHAA